jgi:hypothetical protein
MGMFDAVRRRLRRSCAVSHAHPSFSKRGFHAKEICNVKKFVFKRNDHVKENGDGRREEGAVSVVYTSSPV